MVITHNNSAEHLAVGDVEAAVGVSLQFDVLHRVISAVSEPVATHSNGWFTPCQLMTITCTYYRY